VNSDDAIVMGGLANRPQFFGGNTAEILSVSNRYAGGWNGDYAYSVQSARPWFMLGGRADDSESRPGAFAFYNHAGGAIANLSHRTILSGY
jgi:hypothetical protein